MTTAPRQHITDPVGHLLHISMGVVVMATLRAALDCNIADELASGPKSAKELAAKAKVNEDALYRSLRVLTVEGIFEETAPGVFANTPVSEFLRAGHPARLRDNLLFSLSGFILRTYSEFNHALRTGQTCVEPAFGMSVFDYFPTNQQLNREFNNAMTAITSMVVPAVLETYDFSGMGTLCDVAGGHGFLLTSILAKHSDLHGILFDLEHVVDGAKERISSMGLAGRCKTASGDFFESVPAADSYIMKHIIHDWEESKAVAILRNCAKAMRGNGKILLVEAVLPGPNVPHSGKYLDLHMLVMPGGKERSENEYRELFAKAGLKLVRIVPNNSPLWVLEAVKA